MQSAAGGRFACVTCRAPLRQLTRLEQGSYVVDHCASCGALADPYLERDGIHAIMDALLLRQDCWIHVLHNAAIPFQFLAFMAITACLLEAFVHAALTTPQCLPSGRVIMPVQNTTSLMALLGSDADAPSVIEGVSLRLTDVLPRCAWQLTEPLLHGLLMSSLELLFGGIVMVWAASLAGPGVNVHGHGTRGMRAGVFSASCLLSLALFLVWDVPLLMLAVVDVSRAVWMVVALKALSGASSTSVCFMGLISVTCHVLFKLVTSWSPVLLTTHVFTL